MANNTVTQEYIKSIESLRRDNRDKMHRSAMRWNELANKRSADLSKYLFTISSLILPLSLLPVTQEGFSVSDGNVWKIVLVFAWISLVFSLVFGLIHLTKEIGFFNMWAKQENNRSQVYSEGIFATEAQEAFDRLEVMNKRSMKLARMPDTSNPAFLRLQQGTLVLGVIFIGVVLTLKLLFPPTSECQKYQETTIISGKKNDCRSFMPRSSQNFRTWYR